jgi:hypothetical protein
VSQRRRHRGRAAGEVRRRGWGLRVSEGEGGRWVGPAMGQGTGRGGGGLLGWWGAAAQKGRGEKWAEERRRNWAAARPKGEPS